MTSILSPYRGRWITNQPRWTIVIPAELDHQLGRMPVLNQTALVVFGMPIAEELVFRGPILFFGESVAVFMGIAFLLVHLIWAHRGNVGTFLRALPWLIMVTVITSLQVSNYGPAGLWYAIVTHISLNALVVAEITCQRELRWSPVGWLLATLNTIFGPR